MCSQFALFYPVLPCPVTAWGASSSRKGRRLWLLIQQCVNSLLRSCRLCPPRPHTFLQKQDLSAFLAGILGHANEWSPVWGETVRQQAGPKNSAPRRRQESWLLSHHRLSCLTQLSQLRLVAPEIYSQGHSWREADPSLLRLLPFKGEFS